MTDEVILGIFERTFRGRTSGCRRDCECGITYWDSYNSGYDWEEGEREALEADPKAKALSYGVGVIEFEGRMYVDGCTCWHARALKIAKWIIAHDEAIAEFLTERKKELTRMAESAPVVKS